MSTLKERRMALGLTQDEAAALIGIPMQHYSQIERGRIQLPRIELRRRLAKAYQMRHVDVLVALGVLEDWEIPGATPSVDDPVLKELQDQLALVDLNSDQRREMLLTLFAMFLRQDQARQSGPERRDLFEADGVG